VWTPKRILLLAVGFVLFTLAYILYSATSLGRINTLPPLPDQYRIGNTDSAVIRPLGPRANPLERKLELAFGQGCKEKKWPVLLELNSKSMVMAADSFEVQKDGRVKLKTMSLALFGKKKNDGRDIEINTLKCDEAYITFDRPVTSLSPSELSGRKIKEAELWGAPDRAIVIKNNRRTALDNDDLTVTIAVGPLHYIENKQFIWTRDRVHLQDGLPDMRDGRLIPPKADIVATGMEMQLATAAPPPKPGVVVTHKPKNESISGVKRIVLKQDVTMHLYTSGATPFPGGDKSRPATATTAMKGAVKPPPESAHIFIRTPGRFQYDLFKDHDMAQFDVPQDADQPTSPQDVTVVRVNERLGNDQLICKHLTLRLKRRDSEATPAGRPTTAAAQTPEQGMEIETAHATGPEVTLTSDAEKLDAHGNDFFYDAGKKLTILKGVPLMEANKDESIIQAPELQIQDIPLPTPPGSPAKTYQQVIAKGPGQIHLPKKIGDKTVHKTHAFWKDKLISTRDGELDLLVLTGSARFEDESDEDNKQSLKAETIKVWLLAEDKKPETTKAATATKTEPTKTSASPQQARRPHIVHALRNVMAHSRDLRIHDTSRLIIRFTDVPAARMPPPSAGDKRAVKPPDNKAMTSTRATGGTPVPPNRTLLPPGKTLGLPKTPPPPEPRPIDLSARSIEAEVLRCAERLALNHLWAEGSTIDNKGGVKVRQAPATPGDRGVDIVGNTLDMKCHPEGNELVVSGDMAQLLMDKILIFGPTVNIDQAANKAWVYGHGAMELQSNQTLEGKPLGRTVPLTIHWSERMYFQGGRAEFDGNIQAVQENARLACKQLQVFFDRPISLKEGARGDQPAKVRSLVGDKEVRVEDETVVQGKLQKYQLLEGSSIAMSQVPREDSPPTVSRPTTATTSGPAKSNDANEVRLTGPGSVRILQRGGADSASTPGKPAPNKPGPRPASDEQEIKLTYVSFQKLMRASSLTNTADFWGSVRVLNLPCDDPHREIDLDAMLETELPEEALYLCSNRLKVLSHPTQGGKSYQEMEAHGQVWVQAREFSAQSDHMTYNEAKDQIIFTGEGNNLAVLSRVRFKGANPEVMRGRKITYKRSTGEATSDGTQSLNGGG